VFSPSTLERYNNPSRRKVVGISGPGSGLQGLVRIEMSALDKWFVEDEPILGPHPKDPYKRVECLPSSREGKIVYKGTVSIIRIFLDKHSGETSL
jgi:hypothetical protein